MLYLELEIASSFSMQNVAMITSAVFRIVMPFLRSAQGHLQTIKPKGELSPP